MAVTRSRVAPEAPEVVVSQYSRAGVLGVWAAAALPMAALAWVVAPLAARSLDGPAPLARSLICSLAAGLIWQFVLVVILLRREQGTWRWQVVREALWLRAPRSPRTGRRGGRLWLLLLPLLVLFAAEELVPMARPPAGRHLPDFLDSAVGRGLLEGSWLWVAVLATTMLFNTVLGEELLFRGWLLPRMQAAFGRADWAVNGVLFAIYHLHMPWVIPGALVDTLAISYPARRYRSALIGIAVHSAQSVVLLALVLALVLG